MIAKGSELSMGWHFLIGILVTTAGAMALPLTLFFAFFEVKPEQRKQLSRREMAAAIIALALLVLGIVNMYMLYDIGYKDHKGPDSDDQTEDSQEPGTQEDENTSGQDDSGTADDSSDKDLSPEELLVKENWDEIQRLKAEYSKTDTETVKSESESLQIEICETAGYIFLDLMKTEACATLDGMRVPNVTLVVMDYSTDQILCSFNSGEGWCIVYSPGNEEEFYAVAFHDDYDIYVTHPFKVIHGEGNHGTSIYLEKKGSQYTPPCRLRLFMRDMNTEHGYFIVPTQYKAVFTMEKNGTQFVSFHGRTTESGILTWSQGTYFSLNTDYIMDIYLREAFEDDSIESMHQTFDGSITNSNQIDFYFDFNQEGGST